VLRAKRDHRIDDDGVTRIELDAMLADDHREDDLRFHEREVISDARAWTAAEREIRPLRPALRARGKEALGIETLRVLP
jgi:hypothetical protein